jgi:hypothetical protein
MTHPRPKPIPLLANVKSSINNQGAANLISALQNRLNTIKRGLKEKKIDDKHPILYYYLADGTIIRIIHVNPAASHPSIIEIIGLDDDGNQTDIIANVSTVQFVIKILPKGKAAQPEITIN